MPKVSDFAPPNPPKADEGPLNRAGIVILVGALLGVFVHPLFLPFFGMSALVGLALVWSRRESSKF